MDIYKIENIWIKIYLPYMDKIYSVKKCLGQTVFCQTPSFI